MHAPGFQKIRQIERGSALPMQSGSELIWQRKQEDQHSEGIRMANPIESSKMVLNPT